MEKILKHFTWLENTLHVSQTKLTP